MKGHFSPLVSRDHGDWDVEKRSSSNSMTFIVYIFNIENHTHYIDAVTHRTIDGISFLSSTTSTWFVHPLNNSFVDRQVRKFILYQNIDFDMSWLQCVSFSHIFTLWFSTYVQCDLFLFSNWWWAVFEFEIQTKSSGFFLHSNTTDYWFMFTWWFDSSNPICIFIATISNNENFSSLICSQLKSI